MFNLDMLLNANSKVPLQVIVAPSLEFACPLSVKLVAACVTYKIVSITSCSLREVMETILYVGSSADGVSLCYSKAICGVGDMYYCY